MDDRIRKWKDAEIAHKNAEEWNDLPNGRKYSHSDFDISIAHCKPPTLSRMGQKHQGDRTYWETEEEFNQAMLRYLVDNWDSHYPKILEILKQNELVALNDCQSYIDEVQYFISTRREELKEI